jgi:hypothetical protein
MEAEFRASPIAPNGAVQQPKRIYGITQIHHGNLKLASVLAPIVTQPRHFDYGDAFTTE